MSRCELSGKRTRVKNLVSHSNIKTKSVAMPNVQKKRIFSRTLNQMIRLHIATSTLKDIEHMGGFDVYILNQKKDVLSPKALGIQSRIRRKMNVKKSTIKE